MSSVMTLRLFVHTVWTGLAQAQASAARNPRGGEQRVICLLFTIQALKVKAFFFLFINSILVANPHFLNITVLARI